MTLVQTLILYQTSPDIKNGYQILQLSLYFDMQINDDVCLTAL